MWSTTAFTPSEKALSVDAPVQALPIFMRIVRPSNSTRGGVNAPVIVATYVSAVPESVHHIAPDACLVMLSASMSVLVSGPAAASSDSPPAVTAVSSSLLRTLSSSAVRMPVDAGAVSLILVLKSRI